MKKHEFLDQLHKALSGLPPQEIDEQLIYYSEMIDDRVEEGFSEGEAILQIGTIEEIASQIIAEKSFAKVAKERLNTKRRLKAWEIVLLAVGSPLWITLITSAAAVIFSIYISLWAVIISLWAIFASVAACAPSCMLAGILFILESNVLAGVTMVSLGIICAGLAIFIFFGCKLAVKGVLQLTKSIVMYIKKFFIKKEKAL